MLKYLSNLISLLYPNVCCGCDREDAISDGLFCSYCLDEIPDFGTIGDNKEILSSRFPLICESGFYGLFLFTKNGIVQNVLHKIKYNNRADIAKKLGERIAHKYSLDHYDVLVPIPMHSSKQRKRGYNQAEEIAKGIHMATNVPICHTALKKKTDTKSQTQRDRISRRLNVLKSYDTGSALSIDIKKVLLIDDVVTTGATLEVCSEKLRSYGPLQIDYAFIALSI